MSTVTILPHVLHALRTKKPGGSPLAWALGAVGSTVWVAYGVGARDLLVAAPGLVTIPCGLFLAATSTRAALAARRVGVRPVTSIAPRAERLVEAAPDLEVDALEPVSAIA